MDTAMKCRVLAVSILLSLAFVPHAAAAAQTQQPPPAPAAEPGPVTPGQLQALFDAYTIVQAQSALDLSNDQYGSFVSRLKTLQETRRRHQTARQRILAELRRLTNPQRGTNDEPAISERLKALRDEDTSAAGDLEKAYEGVDQVLTLRQQARFRLFEERMEQQKLDLVLRARAAARARRGGQ
jgi:Spy/CpxP family protein refolding chaperone